MALPEEEEDDDRHDMTEGGPLASSSTAVAAAPAPSRSKNKNKPNPKKRSQSSSHTNNNGNGGGGGNNHNAESTKSSGKDSKSQEAAGGAARKKARKQARQNRQLSGTSDKSASGRGTAAAAASSQTGTSAAAAAADSAMSAAQQAVNEQLRRVLEEDQYSAQGSIVDTDSDEDEQTSFLYRGHTIRLDRAALIQTVRKHYVLPAEQQRATRVGNVHLALAAAKDGVVDDDDEQGLVLQDEDDTEEGLQGAADMDDGNRSARRNKSGGSKKSKRKEDDRAGVGPEEGVGKAKDTAAAAASGAVGGDLLDVTEEDYDRDGGSIFGHTAGSTSATWVECDKCKKWRRLRGVVDEKKLPPKWYCSMNKNDPERARCSAPEEEYEAPHTPESAADARTRKHLRVWVRRLQCNEAYEARQPTLTRGKKRATVSTNKDPYEWVRCCNPSCGKWRAILRIMDAKTNVIDRTVDGEWYCVMNTWDEKTASCAAPQENLPAVGCPPWVMQDEE